MLTANDNLPFTYETKDPLQIFKIKSPHLEKAEALLIMAHEQEDFEWVKLLHETIKLLKDVDGR